MTDKPGTHRELVRTLIRAVDAADHDAIAALTAADVHFRFGNAAPTDTQSELLAAAQSFAMRSPICATPSSTCGRSTTAWWSRSWRCITGDLTAAS